MRNMTGRLVETRRGDFMSAAEKELVAFELKERELRRQERLERAEQLFPALAKELRKPGGGLDNRRDGPPVHAGGPFLFRC